jgi:hypothetical protein
MPVAVNHQTEFAAAIVATHLHDRRVHPLGAVARCSNATGGIPTATR